MIFKYKGGIMIQRELYLNKLIGYRDKNLIKVITGVRRCGKSTLLEMFQEYLFKHDISKEQILTINFEDIDLKNLLILKTYMSM